jgi:hypothetical protein
MRLFLLLPLIALLSGCRTNESPEGQVDDLEITAQLKSKLASDVVNDLQVVSRKVAIACCGQSSSCC